MVKKVYEFAEYNTLLNSPLSSRVGLDCLRRGSVTEESTGSGAEAGRGVVVGAVRLSAESRAGADWRFGSPLTSSSMNCNKYSNVTQAECLGWHTFTEQYKKN